MREKAAQILEETKQDLLLQSPRLIEAFKEIVIGGKWEVEPPRTNKDVIYLEIEFGYKYDMYLYPMDHETEPIGGVSLLRNVMSNWATTNPKSMEEFDYDIPEDEQDLNEYHKLLKPYYMNWVADCFMQAGAADFDKDVFIMEHDGGKPFNLKTREQGWEFYPEAVEEEEED